MMQKGIRAIFFVPVCILLVLLFYYKSYLSPVRGDIMTADREISSLRAYTESVQAKTEEIKGIIANMDELESMLQSKKADLPDKLDPYDIILLLSGIEQNILTRNSLIFLDLIDGEDYIVLPVRFHFSSDYSGFIKLLSFLDSLDIRPSISNMQMSAASAEKNIRNSMDESGKVIYNLDVEMTLNFYVGRN